MPEQRIQYSNREIVFDEEDVRLVIDGTEIQVERRGDAFLSYARPYEQFLSLQGLAQALIDDETLPEEA